MASGDGTGPMGMGRMTGRAAGFCAGFGVPGYTNPGRGGGRGRGRGFGGGPQFGRGVGFGRGRSFGPAYGPVAYGPAGYGAPYGEEQELEQLKGQADYFANALEDIKKRIDGLESQDSTSAEKNT